jgi:hypothetical protein
MKARSGWLLVCGLIIATTHVIAQRRESRGELLPEARENGWFTSLDEGRAEAQKTGMPLMVVIRCQP